MSTRRVLVIAAGDCKHDEHNNHQIDHQIDHQNDHQIDQRTDQQVDRHSDPGRQLLSRLQNSPVAEHWWLTLIGESQFQLEHAMDLQINDLVIFVSSAAHQHKEPFSFRRVTRPDGYRISTTTQSLSPSDVLHALSTISRRESLPMCFELNLDSGEDAAAQENEQSLVDGALAFLDELLANTDPQSWENQQVA